MKTLDQSPDKQRQLRRHKQLATGLFLLMVAVYAVMTWMSRSYPEQHWTGYVRAFAEAAMVGALADWFAVTALFHHPLGIPIPHTNLIEKSKQSIGNNLGSFVVNNFLTPQNIRPYISRLSVSGFAAGWLASGRNKALLAKELGRLLKDIVQKLDDEAVPQFIARKGNELIGSVKLHLIAANALQYLLDRGEHEKLITTLAATIKTYVSNNEMMVQERVKKESYFFIPKFIDNKLAGKITHALMRYFEEIETDRAHKIRQDISEQAYRFVADLRTLPRWEEELQQLRGGLLSEERIETYAQDVWQSLKQTLLGELGSEDSALLRYFSKMTDDFSRSLAEDEVMRQRIDSWVRFTAYKYILRNTDNAGLLISNTVGNWQGRELSRKLELEVGKDLQFIRINGTLVGGLVGLLIYTITQLLS